MTGYREKSVLHLTTLVDSIQQFVRNLAWLYAIPVHNFFIPVCEIYISAIFGITSACTLLTAKK